MHYEANINGKTVLATPGRRLWPDHGSGTFTPVIEFQAAGGERIRTEISCHQTFIGSLTGGDECDKYLDEVLTGLGFLKIPDPEPVKCEHCGATKCC